MQCPYFTVLGYGAFDSAAFSTNKRLRNGRLICAYEFEFYTEDCLGGLAIEGKRCPVKKDHFTLSKPGQFQRVHLPYKCYYLNISTQDESLCAMLDQIPNYGVAWNMERIIEIFQEMLTVENTSLTENRLHLEGCICRILSTIARSRSLTVDKGGDNTLLHKKNLQLADQYLREHYSEPITLQSLAEQFNLHPNYFHRLYTAAYGQTPAQRLLSFRIAAAKTALITTSLSMSEIAASCGFTSQTYFGYKFREVTGHTPLQYRKRMLGKR